jgi:protein gp37
VWLGTTAENQRWADRRIDRLLTVDARVHFLSCEPLLSSIDLTPWLKRGQIGWIIAGGESGGDARPSHPNWIRSLRDQAAIHGVPFHFKQWGHWSPEAHGEPARKRIELYDEAGRLEHLSWRPKKVSGRTLDGHTYDQYPQAQE